MLQKVSKLKLHFYIDPLNIGLNSQKNKQTMCTNKATFISFRLVRLANSFDVKIYRYLLLMLYFHLDVGFL